MPFDGTLKFDTAIDKTGINKGLKSIGSIVKTGMKAVAGAAAVGTAAVAALGKQALDAYADYEQLTGGIETLFGNASQTVMENAAKAFQTAGMSANDYMETATASAAAMVNSLSGDTKKAAELTDMAVTDMADNINKMGSASESVQDAYSGFAKGNFTMLDNLKLGYGGTKEEMERLLQTAAELTGVEYDINSYADIVQAIHEIQKEMGISGTTAKEASETISGSVAALKAAWENLLVGVADDTQDFDGLIDDLVESAETAAWNIAPRIGKIAEGAAKLIGALGGEILSHLPEIAETGASMMEKLVDQVSDPGRLKAFLNAGANLLEKMAQGMQKILPKMLPAAKGIVQTLGTYLEDQTPKMADAALSLVQALCAFLDDHASELTEYAIRIVGKLGSYLAEYAPKLGTAALTILSTLAKTMIDNLPELYDAAADIVVALCDGISENSDELLNAAKEFADVLLDNFGNQEVLDKLFEAAGRILGALIPTAAELSGKLLTFAADFFTELGDKLSEYDLDKLEEIGNKAIDAMISGMLDVEFDHTKFWDNFGENWKIGFEDIVSAWELGFDDLKEYWEAGFDDLKENWELGLESLIELAFPFADDLFSALADAMAGKDWLDIGINMLNGILSGLMGQQIDLKASFADFASNWLAGIQNPFEINSPSRLMRDEVGKYLAQGIGVGFTEEMPDVGQDAVSAFDRLRSEIDPGALRAVSSPAFASLPYDVTPSVPGQIINNYTNTTAEESGGSTSETQDFSGDIIIPITIGGERLDTIVIRAAQIANARSGGVTL